MQLVTVQANRHRLEEYADVFDGHQAIQLIDESGEMRGELVWRLATGQTVEITEMGVFEEVDRRQGWGSKLLDAGLEAIREFFVGKPYRLRRVYLFCDSINQPARAFYESHGFRLVTVMAGFYHYCDASLYVLNVESADGS